MDVLGWIIAAFLAGVLLAGMFRKPIKSLKSRFSAIDRYRGLTSTQVISAIGSAPQTIIHRSDGQSLMVWQDHGYTITLRFDQHNICLGVEEEKECMP